MYMQYIFLNEINLKKNFVQSFPQEIIVLKEKALSNIKKCLNIIFEMSC